MAENIPKTPTVIADEQWRRYEYARDRGHIEYIGQAAKCERFYLGGGLQWADDDVRYLEEQGRKPVEINTIFPAINTAVGEQLQSRVDISFKPAKSGASQEIAELLSKITMQVADDNRFEWLETEVFADGIIQQRGYFDIRMDFDDNLQGDIRISVIDPLEVIPDPDAQSYDPAKWKDVIVTKWMSIDEIEQMYGKDAADEVERTRSYDPDFGIDQGDDETRNRFGGIPLSATVYDSIMADKQTKRVRVIDRQHRRMELQQFYVNQNGDLRPVPENMSATELAEKIQAEGWTLTKKVVPRVRWTVTTRNSLLHDDWSPYRWFTVVPFFPYFRRGKTRGLIDNAISPQEMLNKATSQYLHIINTMANSGWTVEQDSLTNMDVSDLEDVGMKTGLVIEYRGGKQPPQKIQPNQIPQGHDRIADKAEFAIKSVTGISDAEQGMNSAEVSGKAIQAKQFQAKIQLSVPLDSLHRTRNLLASRILDLIQQFFTEQRIFMITRSDEVGEAQHEPIEVNIRTASGEILNNLTLGEYDVVISSVPQQATFENNQFQQMMEMRQMGVQIPDAALVQASSIARKGDLVKQMQSDPAQSQFNQQMQQAELAEKAATTALKEAQALKAKSASTVDNVEAMYAGVQAAQVITSVPNSVPVADEIIKSAGFVDKNATPLIPYPAPPAPASLGVQQPMQMHRNTSPMFPAHPDGPGEGMMTGIETPTGVDNIRMEG